MRVKTPLIPDRSRTDFAKYPVSSAARLITPPPVPQPRDDSIKRQPGMHSTRAGLSQPGIDRQHLDDVSVAPIDDRAQVLLPRAHGQEGEVVPALPERFHHASQVRFGLGPFFAKLGERLRLGDDRGGPFVIRHIVLREVGQTHAARDGGK